MLRAVIWDRDAAVRRGARSLDTGHDLRELLAHVRDLGLLDADRRDERFAAAVQRVGRLWFNNMRFASSKARCRCTTSDQASVASGVLSKLGGVERTASSQASRPA